MSDFTYLSTVDKHSPPDLAERVVNDLFNNTKNAAGAAELLAALLRLAESPLNVNHLVDLDCGVGVAATLSCNMKSVTLSIACLRLLKKFEGRSYEMKQSKVPGYVVGAMLSHQDPHVKIEALKVVEALGRKQCVAEEFVSKQVVRCFRHCLRDFPKNDKIQIQAFKAIISLAHTKDIKIEYFKQGLGHYIIHSLRELSKIEAIQDYGLQALRKVSGSYALIHLGAHNVGLDAISNHGTANVLIAACDAFKVFSDMEYNVTVLLKANIVPTIIGKLKFMVDDERAIFSGLHMFSFLGRWDSKKGEIWNSGLGSFLSLCCDKQIQSSRVLENAFGIINNMATVETLVTDMFNIGVVSCLIEGLAAHPKRSIVQERGIAAIRNISVWNQANVRYLMNLGAVDIVNAAKKRHKTRTTLQKYSTEFLEKAAKLQ